MTATSTKPRRRARNTTLRLPASDRLWYSMYGLRVRSDIRLPFPALANPPAGPDLELRRARSGEPTPRPQGPPLAMTRCEHGDPSAIRYATPGVRYLWTPAVSCVVSADVRHLDVYPRPDCDDHVLGLVLACQVSIFVLQLRGYPTLHASAVTIDGEAVVFLGHPGQGKSTLASALLSRGGALLTDDALPLSLDEERVRGMPGPPFMKLWETTAVHGLGLRPDELPPIAADHEKKLLDLLDGRYALATAAAPVRAIYLVRRFDPTATGHSDVTVQPLSGSAALAKLLEHTSPAACLHGGEWAKVLRAYQRLAAQAPISVLSFPSGFEHQAAVSAQILTDIAEMRRTSR